MNEPDPRPRGLLLAWAVSLLLLAAAAAQLARTYADARFGGAHFEPGTADFLYPAALYDDVFVTGYSLRGFQCSAATFAVPDVLLYVPIRAVAGSTGAALMPWHAACFFALVISAWYALAGFAAPRARPWVGPALGCVTAAFLAAQAAQFLRTDARHFLYPDCHTGAQTLAFLSLGLLARYTRDGDRWRLAALAAVSLVAAFSDRLYAVYFAVPAFAALGLVRLLARELRLTWRRDLASVAAVAMGCLAGLALLKWLPSPGLGADPLDNYWQGIDAAGLGPRARHLAGAVAAQLGRGDALVAAGVGWLLAAALGLAVGPVRRGRGGAFALYSLIAAVAAAGALVVSATGARSLGAASPAWGDFDRYFAGPLAAGLFGWALPLAWLLARGGSARALAAAGAVALAAWPLTLTVLTPREPSRDLLDPYPDYVRALDEVCRRRGLTRGYAGFFQAGPATHFSEAGVRVVALATNPGARDPVTPFVWLSNAGHLTRRPGEAAPEFVLAHPGAATAPSDLTADAVRAAFGEPAETVPAGNFVILVYDRHEDVAIRDYLDWHSDAALARYRTSPGDPVRFWARGLRGDTGRREGTSRAAAEGDAPGALASGPYLRPPRRGWHFAKFRVRSSGSPRPNGSLAVHLVANDHKSAPLLAGPVPVPPGFDGTVRLEFHVSREALAAGFLEFRADYHGPGRLAIDSVEFGPLPRGAKPRGETVCPIASSVR